MSKLKCLVGKYCKFLTFAASDQIRIVILPRLAGDVTKRCLSIHNRRSVLRRQSTDTNGNMKRLVYCRYG